MKEIEIWKEVVGWEGRYSISSLGNVMSHFSNRIMRQSDNGGGYNHVVFTKFVNGKKIMVGKYPHRLVAEAFVENNNPEECTEVNHINLDKKMNVFTNLEWVTRKQNIRHAIDNGAIDVKGSNSSLASLSSEQVKLARDYFKNILPENVASEIISYSKHLNVNHGTLRRVLNNERYVDDKYIPSIKPGNIASSLGAIKNREQVFKMRDMKKAGYTARYIAKEMGLPYQSIVRVLQGKTWTHV